MVDGIYQSIMSFFIPYVFVILTTTAASNGLDVAERARLGAYIAHPAVFTINMYILINTHRWDWLLLLVIVLSDLFIFFWTGVYTAFTSSASFYQAAPQIYQELTFWMTLIVTPAICILPRVAIKCIQKHAFPYDVDIIREQVSQGKFDADRSGCTATDEGLEGTASETSEASSRKGKAKHAQYASVDEDRRPIYPPSVATHNTRNQNGSDGTDYTMHRQSLEVQQEGEVSQPTGVRPSIDRARPSYDRVRASVDRVRPSLEASNDFTSAARLSRIESSHSAHGQHSNQRRFNLTTVRKRGLSAFSKKSIDQ
jgi:phospholipid-translocating ATPase